MKLRQDDGIGEEKIERISRILNASGLALYAGKTFERIRKVARQWRVTWSCWPLLPTPLFSFPRSLYFSFDAFNSPSRSTTSTAVSRLASYASSFHITSCASQDASQRQSAQCKGPLIHVSHSPRLIMLSFNMRGTSINSAASVYERRRPTSLFPSPSFCREPRPYASRSSLSFFLRWMVQRCASTFGWTSLRLNSYSCESTPLPWCRLLPAKFSGVSRLPMHNILVLRRARRSHNILP
jgi:hypothetical protein